jgi:hypothetical protein
MLRSVGAVASIFDISCIDKTPAFATIQTTAFKAWSAVRAGVSPSTIGDKIGAATLLGVRSHCSYLYTFSLNSFQYHYFVPAPSGTGLSPKWDFTSTGKFAGNSTAFILAAKAGDILAPTNSATNVDWLMLNNVQGSLASKVFRVDTVNGQPPTSVSVVSQAGSIWLLKDRRSALPAPPTSASNTLPSTTCTKLISALS